MQLGNRRFDGSETVVDDRAESSRIEQNFQVDKTHVTRSILFPFSYLSPLRLNEITEG